MPFAFIILASWPAFNSILLSRSNKRSDISYLFFGPLTLPSSLDINYHLFLGSDRTHLCSVPHRKIPLRMPLYQLQTVVSRWTKSSLTCLVHIISSFFFNNTKACDKAGIQGVIVTHIDLENRDLISFKSNMSDIRKRYFPQRDVAEWMEYSYMEIFVYKKGKHDLILVQTFT